MIIPPKEIIENNNHYIFKTEVDISLEYQLSKLVFFCKKVEKHIDNERKTHYISEESYKFYLDSVINNYSTLIEYYYSWILLSLIGTIKPQKISYRAINRDDPNEIDKIFNKYYIGVLEKSNIDKEEYIELCKNTFLEAYDFIFIDKFHELYVLNNYLKHNRMSFEYCPKINIKNKEFSFPFIHISKSNTSLVNNSVLKYVLESDFYEDGKIISDKEDLYTNIIMKKCTKIGAIGGINIININDIDYVKSNGFSGFSVESILSITYQLCLNIIKVIRNNCSNEITLMEKLNRLEENINKREPKTFNKLV